MARKARPLGVALQGGGAHGAFTWGVLDRLLEDGRFDIQAITGTSAGSVNAAALAYGLVTGGPDTARELLETVWLEVGKKGPGSAMITGSDDDPSLSMFARMGKMMTSSLSPTELNPLGIDPIREVLEAHIDFEELRTTKSPVQMGIAATNAFNGRVRIFTRQDMSIEAILASACLPKITAAVEIDGVPYWDGGYSSNPPLTPLLWSGIDDALIVLIVPLGHEGTPESQPEIAARETEFPFTSGFHRESEMLAAGIKRAHESKWPFVGKLEKQLRRMRWHVMDGGEVTGELHPESRMIAYVPFLESLRDAGREYAESWLGETGALVGRTSTADLRTFEQLAS